MPIFYPNIGTMELAGDKQTALANSVVSLFKSTLVPSVGTTKAELEAAECDYTGYATKAIVAWQNPLLDPAGGASIESGVVQFEVGANPVATNLVGGFWIEKATGEVIAIGVFPQAVPMELQGQGIPLNVKLVEPSGQTV